MTEVSTITRMLDLKILGPWVLRPVSAKPAKTLYLYDDKLVSVYPRGSVVLTCICGSTCQLMCLFD